MGKVVAEYGRRHEPQQGADEERLWVARGHKTTGFCRGVAPVTG
jgi:hypothetical protein